MPRTIFEELKPTQLRLVLTKHNISQSAVVRGTGFSTATISLLCCRHQYPTGPATAQKLRDKLREFLRTTTKIAEIEIDQALDNIQPDDAAQELFAKFPPRGYEAATQPVSLKQLPNQQEFVMVPQFTLSFAAKKAWKMTYNPFRDVASDDDVFKSEEWYDKVEEMYQTSLIGGMMAMVGESGAGKTTMLDELKSRLATAHQQVVVIEPFVLSMEKNTATGRMTLSSTHISQAIIRALDVTATIKTNTQALHAQARNLLIDSHNIGRRHVLIIEEAHSLPVDTLKHLKRYLEIKNGRTAMLGIILIAQPELLRTLHPSVAVVREVLQRCTVHTVPAMTHSLEQYLAFKLKAVGKAPSDVFAADAYDAIRLRLSSGPARNAGDVPTSFCYPLAINNFMTLCMNTAAEIAATKIDARLVMAIRF